MAIGEVRRGLDPSPAFGADRLGRFAQSLGDEHVDQSDILQPSTIIALEEIAQNDAASLLIGDKADEQGAAIGGPHAALGQRPADLIGLFVIGLGQALPDLLLPRVVAGDGEGHELFEAHAVLDIDLVQLGRDRGQTQPLLDDLDADVAGDGDLVFVETLLPQRLERPELVERMQRGALLVLLERILLRRGVSVGGAHDARHRLGFGHALLLGEQFEGAVAPPACGHLEHAGLDAFGVQHRADVQALEEAAPSDGLGELLDRDAGLDAPDVGLG